jgi:hypothetical protein
MTQNGSRIQNNSGFAQGLGPARMETLELEISPTLVARADEVIE